MYENSKKETIIDLATIEPMPYIKKEEVDNEYYIKIGEEIIKKRRSSSNIYGRRAAVQDSDLMAQKEASNSH